MKPHCAQKNDAELTSCSVKAFICHTLQKNLGAAEYSKTGSGGEAQRIKLVTELSKVIAEAD
ncbi:MAG: hypothetical protein RL392_2339, partial [Pseudomonadota bacterium]